MLKVIYPDQTQYKMPLETFVEYSPIEAFMAFALQGISWELPVNLQTENPLHNEIKQADTHIRASIFFIREEHANAYTRH
jgi:hypothetical protein